MSERTSEHLQPTPPELLPTEFLDRNSRRAYQQEGMQQFAQSVAVARQTVRNPLEGIDESNRLYFRNNKPRSVHVPEADFIINGQLTEEGKGPFAQTTRDTFESSLTLQAMTEPRVDNETGDAVPPTLVVLTKEEYEKERREFRGRLQERLAKTRQASEYEREDSEYDIKKIRRRVIRQQA